MIIVRMNSGLELPIDCEDCKIRIDHDTGKCTWIEFFNVKGCLPPFINVNQIEAVYDPDELTEAYIRHRHDGRSNRRIKKQEGEEVGKPC